MLFMAVVLQGPLANFGKWKFVCHWKRSLLVYRVSDCDSKTCIFYRIDIYATHCKTLVKFWMCRSFRTQIWLWKIPRYFFLMVSEPWPSADELQYFSARPQLLPACQVWRSWSIVSVLRARSIVSAKPKDRFALEELLFYRWWSQTNLKTSISLLTGGRTGCVRLLHGSCSVRSCAGSRFISSIWCRSHSGSRLLCFKYPGRRP